MTKPTAKQLNVIVGQAHWDISHTAVLPSATSMVVTSIFSGMTPGGDDTTIGVYTTPLQNKVLIRTRSDGKVIDDSSGNQVYGRLTESGGTWTLSFFTVGDVPFNFSGHPNAGDAFDLRWCESIQLANHKPTAVVDYAEGIDELMPTSGLLHQHDLEAVAVTSNGQTSFTLSKATKNEDTVQMFVNGVSYVNGVDFTVSSTSVTWNDIPFTLETTDVVVFFYGSV